MRLEDLQRYCIVDVETGRVEYGDFTSIVGAIMRIFGRPPMHPHPAEQWPLEEDEADNTCSEIEGMLEYYTIGRVEWEQRPAAWAGGRGEARGGYIRPRERPVDD